MAVSQQGITTDNGTTFTWDELNAITDKKQLTQLFLSAGVDKKQVPDFLSGLNQYEQDKYANYLNVQYNKDLGKIPELRKLESHLPSFLGGGQVDTKKEPVTSEADLWSQSPLSKLVQQTGIQSKVAQATGAAAQGQTLPAISAQALQEYTKNYILPAQAQLNNMIQGDMSQWQQAINSIANSTGQAGSPVTQAWQEYAKVQSPIYQALGAATARQGLTAPYTTLMNNAIGAQAKIGARALDTGSLINTLLQYGLLDPSGFSTATAGAGGTALGGISGLNLNPASITQAATNAPKPPGA